MQLIRKNMIYAGVGPGLHVTNDACPRVERAWCVIYIMVWCVFYVWCVKHL